MKAEITKMKVQLLLHPSAFILHPCFSSGSHNNSTMTALSAAPGYTIGHEAILF